MCEYLSIVSVSHYIYCLIVTLRLPTGAKGEPGAPGEPGDAGAQGTKGQPGTDGQDGKDGVDVSIMRTLVLSSA